MLTAPPDEARVATIHSQAGQSFFVWVKIPSARTKYLALVDSGATVSTLPNKLFEAITQKERPTLVPSDVRIKAGNDTAIDCLGMADVTVQIQDYEFEQRYYICTNETIGVLGADFLRQHAACMDFGREHLFLQGEWMPVYDAYGLALKKNRHVATLTSVRRTAQPGASLQRQLDAANRADASLARGHVHQGEGSSLTDRLPVIEEAEEETLTSPPYPDNSDDEHYDDISRRSPQLPAPSPLISAWGPRKSVKVRKPDENDVKEIQRSKRRRTTKRLTAVSTDPRHAVLLEVIESPRARALCHSHHNRRQQRVRQTSSTPQIKSCYMILLLSVTNPLM